MFENTFTRMMGIKYPIVQGGMLWISRAELVAEVCNAGALGIITALTFDTPEDLAREIRKARELTDRPFGVNVTFLPTLRQINYDDYFDVIEEEAVKIVETAGRSPENYMDRLKKTGIRIIHKCTSIKHARSAEKSGVDVVSIDGFECAGHPGEKDVTSLVLVPLAADNLGIPVIASGGFGDGRGLVAALALGAQGINMGTRFMVTAESDVHEGIKGHLLQAMENDTVLLLRSLRNTLRVLKTPISTKALAMEKDGAGIAELAPLLSGQKGRELMETGDFSSGVLACGQIVGLIRDVPSIKELVERIMSDAAEIAGNLKF